MTTEPIPGSCTKIPTGIDGFEHLSLGGLPVGRATLVVGTAGAGKTLFALECAWRGIAEFGRKVVFVTFEERPEDLLRNVTKMGWRLDEAIANDQFRIVDASLDTFDTEEVGNFDLSGLRAQMLDAANEIDAGFVILDSVGSLFGQFTSDCMIRTELFRITTQLRAAGFTSMITAERLQEFGLISRFGVEEFVSDNVIVLRNVLEDERCRRTIQILKYRGEDHLKGEFPFTISAKGLSMLPLAAMKLAHPSTTERLRSGSEELDRMCDGGFFRDSVILLSGPTGTGKTLSATTFADQGCRDNEKVLVLAYEESPAQLLRNSQAWGMDFQRWEAEGLLRLVCAYPESAGLEEHLAKIQGIVEEFQPRRIVLDSLSAMERGSSPKVFREFVIGLFSYIKEHDACGFLTCTTPTLSGGESITETHISTLTDAILLLRYVEIGSSMHRGLAVIKMRGSQHDKSVHEYVIDGEGLHIIQPFRGVQNVVLGMPTASMDGQDEHLAEAFE